MDNHIVELLHKRITGIENTLSKLLTTLVPSQSKPDSILELLESLRLMHNLQIDTQDALDHNNGPQDFLRKEVQAATERLQWTDESNAPTTVKASRVLERIIHGSDVYFHDDGSPKGCLKKDAQSALTVLRVALEKTGLSKM